MCAAGQRDNIGAYEIVELIGDGAQGKVFKARRADAGQPERLYALKILRTPPTTNRPPNVSSRSPPFF